MIIKIFPQLNIMLLVIKHFYHIFNIFTTFINKYRLMVIFNNSVIYINIRNMLIWTVFLRNIYLSMALMGVWSATET